MHPMFIVAIPLVLVIVGMVLNSIGLSFDQPPSSAEPDPVKRAAAEKEDFRRFFDRQRSRAVKRQQRIGQYAWLLIIAIIGSFIWLYSHFLCIVGKETYDSRWMAWEIRKAVELKKKLVAVKTDSTNNSPPAMQRVGASWTTMLNFDSIKQAMN